MRTALAVVVAVALVVGALYVRTTVISPDEEGPQPVADGTDRPLVPQDGEVRVACDATLGAACPSGSDVMRLDELLGAFQTQPVVHDILVAPTRVVELIEQSRTSRVTFGDDRAVVATTPLVLATAASLDEVVADACPTVTWSCVADLVDRGALTPAVTDPTRTASGLLAFAAMTGGFLDDPAFSTNVLGGSAFFGWLDAVAAQVPVVSDPLNDLILFNGARNTGAVVIEAVAVDAVGRAATNAPDLSWPTPLAWVGATAVAVGGVDPAAVEEVGRAVGESLLAAGWRGPDGAAVVDGSPPLDPAADALPNGGVLFSLRELAP